MASFEHDGRRYEIMEGHRLDLDAHVIELDLVGDGTRDTIARVMCREGSRQLLVSAGPPDIPVELIERIVAEARSRQSYWESTWDQP